MIPASRPVIGKDLDDLRARYGISVAEACHLFGLSPNKWSEIVNRGADEPVKDIPTALLARLLDNHRWLYEPPEWPTPEEMLELFEQSAGGRITMRTFSALLGVDTASGSRWLSHESGQKGASQRLMYYLRRLLVDYARADEDASRHLVFESWLQQVRNEGFARAGHDVIKTGRWRAKAANDPDPDGDIEHLIGRDAD